MELKTPIENLSRVGPIYQKKLKKLGIKTLEDLLLHFPHRYEDFSNLKPISEVKLGEKVCLQGQIKKIENSRTWKKRMTLTQALVQDDSGAIRVVWFNQPYLTNTLKKGDQVCLAGKTSLAEEGIFLSNPAYEKIGSKTGLTHTGRIIPIYPETEGLSSRWLRFIIKPLLLKTKSKISETLPPEIRKNYGFLDISEALWQIHFPDSLEKAELAKKRFSFEELFYISLWVLREKQKIAKEKAIPVPINLPLIQGFIKNLPFSLTNAQKKAGWQILKDMEKPRPMNRLLEGDVGSGKTIVAMLGILNAAQAGFQTAFMTPTEILAKQHFKTLAEMLKDNGLRLGLLTGKSSKIFSKKEEEIKQKELLEKTAKGEIDVLVGTHALIQEKVSFNKLVFVIVDEQHRFGVEQRAKLCRQKNLIPHLLSMTATPIPRTLALTLYGDLDLSLLDEMPKGRKKIITKIISPRLRPKAYEFIKKEVEKGNQVFVICPRIEPAEDNKKTNNNSAKTGWAEVKAVTKEYEKLSKEVFPELKIAMLHGKIKSKEKEKIMSDFKKGKINILVSTSVVEVGVDIPNATVMMIEGAERFGLAQLHQFRGRVGRSDKQSYCLLFTESGARKTWQRLKALISSENGFELAEKDLQIRGPGEIFGARQWGIPDLAMASLKDIFLVEKSRQAAKEILEKDPQLKKYTLKKKRLKDFEKKIHLE